MLKFEVVFTTNTLGHPYTTLYTYAASRRAAVGWAEDWARRRSWRVESVTPARPHKPSRLSSSAPGQTPRL
jgi:hypothetical protein